MRQYITKIIYCYSKLYLQEIGVHKSKYKKLVFRNTNIRK